MCGVYDWIAERVMKGHGSSPRGRGATWMNPGSGRFLFGPSPLMRGLPVPQPPLGSEGASPIGLRLQDVSYSGPYPRRAGPTAKSKDGMRMVGTIPGYAGPTKSEVK